MASAAAAAAAQMWTAVLYFPPLAFAAMYSTPTSKCPNWRTKPDFLSQNTSPPRTRQFPGLVLLLKPEANPAEIRALDWRAAGQNQNRR